MLNSLAYASAVSTAIRVSSRVLAIRGRIFPSTAQNVTLEAKLVDGTVVAGETNISRSRKPIERVRLVPRRARPVQEALQALRDADLMNTDLTGAKLPLVFAERALANTD